MSYQEWTIHALKAELRQRNAKLCGRKKDLIARLEFLDAHQPSGCLEPEPEFSMKLPDPASYKDIHEDMLSDVPGITFARLEEYLAQFEKQIDKKIKCFYTERFLRYIRMSAHQGKVFLSSSVWAEMRKAACYKVDISLNGDGVIQEAQCECGAGQGPSAHCKHVAAVLYGLISFRQTGDIVTELTCTQVLQTFHQVKRFKGSPMKIEGLETIRGKENSLVYDPRPLHHRYRPGSQDRFRNICLNFAPSAKSPMPVLQLFPPANLPALYHDHDYLTLSPEELYLKNNKVTEITQQQADDLEFATRGQGKCKLWLEVRQHHITSSNFGTICKATAKRDMAQLAKSLTTIRDLRTAPILHGRKYEHVAVEQFERKYGLKTSICGIYVSCKHPQLAASPDRIIDSETCLEVKCPYVSRQHKISPQSVPYLKEDSGELTLDSNHDYYYQVQGQLLCSDRKLCYFVCYTFKDMVVVKVPRNEQFIDSMVHNLLAFYSSHFRETVLQKFLYRNYHLYSFQ